MDGNKYETLYKGFYRRVMISQQVAEINGKPVFLNQIESLEEAKKENMPLGFYCFWSIEGKRIFSPGEYLELVQTSMLSKESVFKDLTNPKNIASYYKQIVKTQYQNLFSHLDDLKKEYAALQGKPEYKAMFDSIESTIASFKDNPVFPDIDGTFRPTKEQAEKLLGKDLDYAFPDKKDMAVYDELQKGKN